MGAGVLVGIETIADVVAPEDLVVLVEGPVAALGCVEVVIQIVESVEVVARLLIRVTTAIRRPQRHPDDGEQRRHRETREQATPRAEQELRADARALALPELRRRTRRRLPGTDRGEDRRDERDNPVRDPEELVLDRKSVV